MSVCKELPASKLEKLDRGTSNSENGGSDSEMEWMKPDSNNEHKDEEESGDISAFRFLWHNMAVMPWPYMLVLPVLYACLIGFGWSKGDHIEDDVLNLWVKEGDYRAHNLEYMKSLGVEDWTETIFVGMSKTRVEGENIFQSNRLKEIKERMEKVEAVTVTHKGETYVWDDLCVNIQPYELPCVRATPMDLFYEARANYFDEQDRLTWYNDIIRRRVVHPLITRFGILSNQCAETVCSDLWEYRTNKNSPGYNPLGMLSDTLQLELSDPCRVCYESGLDNTIQELYNIALDSFFVLSAEIIRYSATLNEDDPEKERLADINDKLTQLRSTMTRDDIAEFYFYYTVRGLYATMGAAKLLETWISLENILAGCELGKFFFGFTHCPPVTINEEAAIQMLLNHADNTFSSITTAGAPLPMWSEGDGSGTLLMGDKPVGGSGINMSAPIDSIQQYLDTERYFDRNENNGWLPLYQNGKEGYAVPKSTGWGDWVETNPLYAWFMASLQEDDKVCGNAYLTGLNTTSEELNKNTTDFARENSQFYCNDYTIPSTENPGDEGKVYTKQHFAKMWFNGLLDSPAILDLKQGEDDPYSWTLGIGCSYSLAGERNRFTDIPEASILYNGSRPLYFWDEGTMVGALSKQIFFGGTNPAPGDISQDNPLKNVEVIDASYFYLPPNKIVERVQHCKRPNGSADITEDDATEIIAKYKIAMEDAWNAGYDDDEAGEVQFVSVFDDNFAPGTGQRRFREVAESSTTLVVVSMALIAIFSVVFLFNLDPVESRVLISLIGVTLVVMAYFASIGLAFLLGYKIDSSVTWTLPFIIIGLGVDDMYIVLMALKKQKGFDEKHFFKAMREVIVPVTMTSLVNGSMLAILTLIDIPFIRNISQISVICVAALYCVIIFCFPAFCYCDMRRQAAGKFDGIFCLKRKGGSKEHETNDLKSWILYEKLYEPLILPEKRFFRILSHTIIFVIGIALFCVGIYGITQREIGVNISDFFPYDTPAGIFMKTNEKGIDASALSMNWGQIDYKDPDVQMNMIKQFEDLISHPKVEKIETKKLWISNFAIWASRLCEKNVDRENYDNLLCGRDQMFEYDSYCSSTWKPNKYNLREKLIQDTGDETCQLYDEGVCRSGSKMHPDDMRELGKDPILDADASFCPTIEGWSDAKWQFCLTQWRNMTDYTTSKFVFEQEDGSLSTECSGDRNNDQLFTWPIPYSSSPVVFAFNMSSTQLKIEFMDFTRFICDDVEKMNCWMTGSYYDMWAQYDGVFGTLLQLSSYAIAIGFSISFLFLVVKIMLEGVHERRKVILGSLFGAFMISLTCLLSLITVSGISILAGVNITGFSVVSFMMSLGFAVEFSVHIVSRWLRACNLTASTSLERVKYTMSFLMMPTFMSFVSSLIGVACIGFSGLNFIHVFCFKPLITMMFVTYFYGIYWLPALLSWVDCGVVKLEKSKSKQPSEESVSRDSEDKAKSKQPSEESVSRDSEDVSA